MKKRLLIIGAIVIIIAAVALGVYEIINSVGTDKDNNGYVSNEKNSVFKLIQYIKENDIRNELIKYYIYN